MFTLGVTVGAYWEIFEWFFVGKYTMADTISDLLVDSGGALAAALVALALRRSGERLTYGPIGPRSEEVSSRHLGLRIPEVDRTPALAFRAMLTEDGAERLEFARA